MLHFLKKYDGTLDLIVHAGDVNVLTDLPLYLAPVYGFLLYLVSLLSENPMGRLYIVASNVYWENNDIAKATIRDILAGVGDEFDTHYNCAGYTEKKGLDLPYIDMAAQYFIAFQKRLAAGDLMQRNPFDQEGHLEVFRDFVNFALIDASPADRKAQYIDELIHPFYRNLFLKNF
jgi:hypothetical protein